MMENVKKLELGVNMSFFCNQFLSEKNLSDKNIDLLIKVGCLLEKDAMQSGETNVLEKAFNYLIEEDSYIAIGDGLGEGLEGEIWQYFTPEQILIVFEKKYRQLLEKNMSRACNTAIALVNTGHFNEFRRIFNQQKVKNSEILVADLEKFVDDEFKKEVSLLREDMKKW